MSLDYSQEGFGTVIDYFDLIYYSNEPYHFGWICLLKLENGEYGMSRIAKNNDEGFDWPAPMFKYYNPAAAYWEHYKKRRKADQARDEQAYLRRLAFAADLSYT